MSHQDHVRAHHVYGILDTEQDSQHYELTQHDIQTEEPATDVKLPSTETMIIHALQDQFLTPFAARIATAKLIQLHTTNSRTCVRLVAYLMCNRLQLCGPTLRQLLSIQDATITYAQLEHILREAIARIEAIQNEYQDLCQKLLNSCLYTLLSDRIPNAHYFDSHQVGCPEIVPGLRAKPIWYSGEYCENEELFPWIPMVKAAIPSIRGELLSLRGHRQFQEYRAPSWSGGVQNNTAVHMDTQTSNTLTDTSIPRCGEMKHDKNDLRPSPGEIKLLHENELNDIRTKSQDHFISTASTEPSNYSSYSKEDISSTSQSKGKPGHSSGDWNVCYLSLHGIDTSSAREKCPITCSLLDKINRHYNHALFSAIAPNTYITPHHGPTNKKLRVHVGLIVPEPNHVGLRVGTETISIQQDEILIFDDSFEHEAWNYSSSSRRIVLIFDIWHPDLSDQEIKLWAYIQRAQMKAAKELGARLHDRYPDHAVDFFQILEENHNNASEDTRIFG